MHFYALPMFTLVCARLSTYCRLWERIDCADPLFLQWRPGGIGRAGARGHLTQVAACNVDRIEVRAALFALRFAGEHDHTPIGRPGGAFIQEGGCQQAFLAAVGAHHTNVKTAFGLFGEGDEIAAWRPDGRAIAALTKADATRFAARCWHHVDLGRAGAIAFKNDLATIWAEAGGGLNGGRAGEPVAAPGPEIHAEEIGVSALRQAVDQAAAIGGKARGKAHGARLAFQRATARAAHFQLIDARLDRKSVV